eukprot:1149048-Pelagomonas_calceolata.AAC.1
MGWHDEKPENLDERALWIGASGGGFLLGAWQWKAGGEPGRLGAGPSTLSRSPFALSLLAGVEAIKEQCRQGKLLTLIEEKKTHWPERAVSLLHHKAMEQTGLVGIRRVTGSNQLQSLAVRSILAFNSASRWLQ